MMLAYPLLNEPCVLQKDAMNTLILENVTQYRQAVERLILKKESEIAFFEKEEEIEQKKILVIHDYFYLDLNERKFLNRIYANLTEEAKSAETMLKTFAMQNALTQYLNELMLQTEYDLEMDEEINLQELFKAAGIHIRQEGQDLTEKLSDYIRIYGQVFFSRVVVFVGLWEICTQEEVQRIVKDCVLNGNYVFDLERRDDQDIRGNKILFDRDLCRVI